jgi:hypothetical protein
MQSHNIPLGRHKEEGFSTMAVRQVQALREIRTMM